MKRFIGGIIFTAAALSAPPAAPATAAHNASPAAPATVGHTIPLTGAVAQAARVTQAARLQWCSFAVLRGYIGGQNAGAGSIFTTLVLRNVGGVPCTLRGYPGISLVDRRGRQLGRAATRFPAARPWIVLRPGGTASTVIHTLNPGVGTTNCLPPSAAIRVYPPDSFSSFLVPARLSECLGALEVRPLVAGSAGM